MVSYSKIQVIKTIGEESDPGLRGDSKRGMGKIDFYPSTRQKNHELGSSTPKIEENKKIPIATNETYKNARNYSEIKPNIQQHRDELQMLSDIFPDWTEDDLLLALQECRFDVQLTASRIYEDNISPWSVFRGKSTSLPSNAHTKGSNQNNIPFTTNRILKTSGGSKPKERKDVTTVSLRPPGKESNSEISSQSENSQPIPKQVYSKESNEKSSNTIQSKKTITTISVKAENEESNNNQDLKEVSKEDEGNLSSSAPKTAIMNFKPTKTNILKAPVIMPPSHLSISNSNISFGNFEDTHMENRNAQTPLAQNMISINQNKLSNTSPSINPIRVSNFPPSEVPVKLQNIRPTDRPYLAQESSNGRNMTETQDINPPNTTPPQYPGYMHGPPGPFNLPVPSMPQYHNAYLAPTDANISLRHPQLTYDPFIHQHQRHPEMAKMNDLHPPLNNTQIGPSQTFTSQSMTGMSSQFAHNPAMPYYFPYYTTPAPGQYPPFPQTFKNMYPVFPQGPLQNKSAIMGGSYPSHHYPMSGYHNPPHQYNTQQYSNLQAHQDDHEVKPTGYPVTYNQQTGLQTFFPTSSTVSNKTGTSNFPSNVVDNKGLTEKGHTISTNTPYYTAQNVAPSHYSTYHGQGNFQSSQFQSHPQIPGQQTSQIHPYTSQSRQFWQNN
jgi:hypothetical protein